MKTTITLTAFAMMILFTACGGDKQEQQQDPAQQEMQQADEATTFYCPMKCEGEKTYAEMGSCPVCGMDLVETEGDAGHMHDGHDHDGDDHEGHSH